MQVRAALQQLALQRSTQVLRTLSAPSETNHGHGGGGGGGMGAGAVAGAGVGAGVGMGVGGRSGHTPLGPDEGNDENVHVITSGRFCRLIPKAHTTHYLRYSDDSLID